MTGSIHTFVAKMRFWANLENPGVGYDQTNRWNLKNGGSVDCSSFVVSCLKIAGFETGDASFTGNMRSELTEHGWVVEPNNGDPQRGDILLKDGHHTAAYLGHGLLAQASIDEKGGITGGKSGDQTRQETNVHSYYDFPWDCYLRYTGPRRKHHRHHAGTENGQHEPGLQKGSTGTRVSNLQEGLNHVFPSYSQLVVDGEFDAKTRAVVEEFQLRAGLPVNGVVGAKTAASLHRYGVEF